MTRLTRLGRGLDWPDVPIMHAIECYSSLEHSPRRVARGGASATASALDLLGTSIIPLFLSASLPLLPYRRVSGMRRRAPLASQHQLVGWNTLDTLGLHDHNRRSTSSSSGQAEIRHMPHHVCPPMLHHAAPPPWHESLGRRHRLRMKPRESSIILVTMCHWSRALMLMNAKLPTPPTTGSARSPTPTSSGCFSSGTAILSL